MMRLSAIVLVGFLVPLATAAQDGLAFDSSPVEARAVPAEALQRFAEDPAFQYDRARTPVESFWRRVGRWLSETFLSPTLEQVPATLMMYLIVALVVAILIFAGIRLFSSRRQGGFARSNSRGLDAALAERGIEEVDLRSWLSEALAGQRYREAVRIHFLIALQELAAAGLITWAPEKTNRAYLGELAASPAEEPFSAFAALFERIWYGGGPAGPPEVDAAARHAASLRGALHRMLEPA